MGEAQGGELRAHLAGVQVCGPTPCVSGTQHVVGDGPVKQNYREVQRLDGYNLT